LNNEKEWQQQAVALSTTGTMSWRGIANLLGIPRSTCSDFLRKYYEVRNDAEDDLQDAVKSSEKHDNSRILFISDMHLPYGHPNTLPFLKMLKERYEPTRVICLGDELDHSGLSFHDSDPDLFSAGHELEKALPIIKELEGMFPKMDLIDSNHGSMVYRKAKHHGVPRRYIKSYNEVLGVGEDWVWHMDLVLDLPDGQKVYVHHGKTSEAIKTSQLMGMSHVCGHYHESFGIKYWSTPMGLYFGMNTGCLIDDKSLAYAYNKVNTKRPIIGTGLIIDGIPVLEAMPL